ncbi:ATP-binding protein, partial [Clostridium sp. AL.422]|nr:ATP-binding protein [Clostridium sp. AL.422]
MDILMIFIEMILTVLLYNSLFNSGKKDKLIFYCIIVAVCSVLYNYYAASYGIFVYIVLLIAEIIAIGYVDKKDNNIVLTEMFISVIITFIIQNSLLTILFFLTGKTKEYRYIHLIFYAFIIILIIALLKYN